jgi:predicted enzyme related to lactoylglutathione lyase
MPSPRPPANVAHVAINADDVARARRFYERVFGWEFRPWGPPGFLQITTGTADHPGILGAL